MDPITALTRPADGPPQGALVLLHGRGSSEHDLVDLFDLVDPERRLVGITPRAPLALPPGGRHWYALREIGYPDPATFLATMQLAGEWLDGLAESTGVPLERTVLGGFSQGCVMSWALGLAAGRQRPAGIIGLSGFMPTVDGFQLDLVYNQLSEAGSWYLTPGFLRITPDVVREVMEIAGSPRSPYFEAMRRQTVPPEALLIRRMEGLLFAVLGELRAGADWNALMREGLFGLEGPTTELGLAEAEWLGGARPTVAPAA